VTRADRIVRAAERLVAAKDRERSLVAGMLRCERADGVDSNGEGNEPDWAFCPKSNQIGCVSGEVLGLLPESQWCPTCQKNIPTLRELRRVRRSLGGLTSALFGAVRSER